MKRAVLLLALAACGDSRPGGTLVIRELSDAEITRLIHAAAGNEGVTAARMVRALDPAGPCPRVEVTDVTTYTGGCTTADVQFEGTVRVRDDAELVFEEFHTAGPTEAVTYDGTVLLRRGDEHVTIDLLVTRDGLAIGAQIERDCDEIGCRFGGEVEIPGRGLAAVTGKTTYEDGAADVRIEGVDRLEVVPGQPYPCLVWRLEGGRTGSLPCAR